MKLYRSAPLVVACLLSLSACAKAQPAADAAPAGKAFLAQNAHADGVHVTPSGLQYKVIKSGPADGRRPTLTDEVKVNYEGKLLDGTIFDSSYQRGTPAVFGLTGLIAGWTEALQLMRPGDEWLLTVPAELAYGDEGAGPIPPGSVLQFRLELISIGPGAGS